MSYDVRCTVGDAFKELVEQAPDGVVILEAGHIVFINATAARLLGVEQAAAIGKPIAAFLPPEEAALAMQRIGRMMATGEESTPNEYGVVGHPDRIVEIKSMRWRWEGRAAVLAFARDVSERKALDQRLINADRLAAVGTLAAGVAHEINNPLTFVRLSLQLIESALAKHPPALASVTAMLRDAEYGVGRVASITRSLRMFARADDAEPGPIDVVAVFDRALKMVDNDLRHRARLVRHAAEVPWVIANASRLEQVFVNLLLNAIQSLRGSKDDSITVEISTRGPREVAVVVRDTGCGIPAAAADRVFDPFFTTKAFGEGMGLGLSVSKNIIDAIGGRIELVSTGGERHDRDGISAHARGAARGNCRARASSRSRATTARTTRRRRAARPSAARGSSRSPSRRDHGQRRLGGTVRSARARPRRHRVRCDDAWPDRRRRLSTDCARAAGARAPHRIHHGRHIRR